MTRAKEETPISADEEIGLVNQASPRKDDEDQVTFQRLLVEAQTSFDSDNEEESLKEIKKNNDIIKNTDFNAISTEEGETKVQNTTN